MRAVLQRVNHAAVRVHQDGADTVVGRITRPGLLALVDERGWPMRFYTPAELAVVPVPNPSETVLRYTGTPSVSEAAALLAAGGGQQPAPMSALVVEKHRLRGPDGRNATVSIARVPPESAALPND